MIYCDSPTLVQWVAPPQEDLPRPTWTKLIAQGVTLSNSIEYANWVADPVEPIVCELCWDATCARAGLARVRRLDDQLVWVPPRPKDVDEFWRDVLTEANFIREPVLIPGQTWEALREKFPRLPAAESYPRATAGDIATLWVRGMPNAVRPPEVAGVVDRLSSALASDPLDLDPAREVIRSMVGWAQRTLNEPVQGRIVRTLNCGVPVNTLYFDGPIIVEWAAFLVGRDNSFTVGEDWVFIPGESSE
jgi:hypothetical protein